jgi:phospholipid/cholesterol/gamma-HCH transport system substrate-binding protein
MVEIKLGIFFIIAAILIFIGLISIRELTLFKGTYVVKVKFNFAEGLRPASPVRFCGVDVGEVNKVEIKSEKDTPIVYVYAKIQSDVKLPRNAHFFINSLSLFGEKYMEITPSPEKGAGYLKPDEIVEGISPIPLFNVFVTFNMTMEEITKFVKEGKLKTSLENAMVNIEKASADIRSIIASVKGKEGTIGKLLYDDSLYRKTEELFDDLKEHPWKILYKPREERKR